jgi:hypothetical protein
MQVKISKHPGDERYTVAITKDDGTWLHRIHFDWSHRGEYMGPGDALNAAEAYIVGAQDMLKAVLRQIGDDATDNTASKIRGLRSKIKEDS